MLAYAAEAEQFAVLPPDALQTALIALAAGLGEGAPCDGELMAAVSRLLAGRLRPGDPPAPSLTGMVVRRDGLPDWWTTGGNLMLAPPSLDIRLSRGFGLFATQRNVGLVGEGGLLPMLVYPGCDGLIAIGDRAQLPYVETRSFNSGAVLVGEDTTADFFAQADSRHGGAIVVGADGMWGVSISLVTDDMHAIRELGTGRRTNGLGGRIVLDRHVWLGDQTAVLGGSRVGADTVVEPQSLVKGALPANSVCSGAPAKPQLSGTTWTREDAP